MNNLWRLFRYDWPLHFVLLFTNWLPDNVVFIRLRGKLARPFFKKCGKQLGIGRNTTFYNPSKIEIGDWVYIANGCWFQADNLIIINDEVLFGPYVVISTSNHTRLKGSWRFGQAMGKDVVIKKGAWIGSHCSILTGSQIGMGCVIASNSVVFEEVKEHVLYAAPKGEVKKKYDQDD